MAHYNLHVNEHTVHWGYFSKTVAPALSLRSGDSATIETLTHHAADDYDRMIRGDAAAERIYHWTQDEKVMARRGAGAMKTIGGGEGLGVHLLTGPVAVEGAEPGDILEVRILDVAPRPSQNPLFAGRTFGSNAAASWGYHYNELLAEPKLREAVTIYEIFAGSEGDRDATPFARALYSYRWEPQTDPFGVVHSTYDYFFTHDKSMATYKKLTPILRFLPF